MNDAVTVAKDGGVYEVTLNRPPANAIDRQTSRRLGEAFAAFRDDENARAAIVTGGGERFFRAAGI